MFFSHIFAYGAVCPQIVGLWILSHAPNQLGKHLGGVKQNQVGKGAFEENPKEKSPPAIYNLYIL